MVEEDEEDEEDEEESWGGSLTFLFLDNSVFEEFMKKLEKWKIMVQKIIQKNPETQNNPPADFLDLVFFFFIFYQVSSNLLRFENFQGQF